MIFRLISIIGITTILPLSSQLLASEIKNEEIIKILSTKIEWMESEFKEKLTKQSQRLFTLFQDSDFVGGDIEGSIGFSSESMESCLNECINKTSCLAFTYILESKKCFLKKEILLSQPEKALGKATGVMTNSLLKKMING